MEAEENNFGTNNRHVRVEGSRAIGGRFEEQNAAAAPGEGVQRGLSTPAAARHLTQQRLLISSW